MSIAKALIAVALVTAAGPVIAAPFGYSISDANATLYRIDLETGLASALGVIPYAVDDEIEGFGSIDGVLYGVSEANDGDGTLRTLLPAPGGVPLATGTRSGTEAGAAGDPTSGVLYNINSDETAVGVLSSLYSLNLGTGAATLIGTSGIFADGLAINSDGVAYASDFRLTDSLYTVDLATGALTLVGGFNIGDVDFDSGLAFDELDQLYALTENGVIYTVNTGTGAASFEAFVVDAAGARIPGDLEGLDILIEADEVPAPASIALLGVAVAGLGVARRRR